MGEIYTIIASHNIDFLASEVAKVNGIKLGKKNFGLWI